MIPRPLFSFSLRLFAELAVDFHAVVDRMPLVIRSAAVDFGGSHADKIAPTPHEKRHVIFADIADLMTFGKYGKRRFALICPTFNRNVNAPSLLKGASPKCSLRRSV